MVGSVLQRPKDSDCFRTLARNRSTHDFCYRLVGEAIIYILSLITPHLTIGRGLEYRS